MYITVIYIVMKLGKELALIAKRKGICQEWFNQMKTLDNKEKLL